jgi:hypothetical protein
MASGVCIRSAVALLATCVALGSLAARVQAQPQPAEPSAAQDERPNKPPTPAAEQTAPPPLGPAEIIRRAAQAQRQKAAPLKPTAASQAVLPGEPAAATPPAAATGASPHGVADTAAAPGAAQAVPPGSNPAGALPSGHPPVDPGAAPPEADSADAPVGNDPHAGSPGAPALARRPLASAEPSATLGPGALRIRVIDMSERPVAGAELQLGVMNRDNTRSTKPAKTGPDGTYLFEQLPIGEGQAYRVNALFDGAKYSTTPFRLPPDRGYEATIRSVPTTRDRKDLVLYVGATSIELRDERLKVVQQARLINIGSKTVVFPKEGELVKLPPGAIAFQSDDVMSDQQLKSDAGGFRINGSVPPGEITLTWGFDLPHTDTEVDLAFELPWITFAYRVLADAAPGLSLEVEGMPPPELNTEGGRRFYVTEIVKRVGDAPLKSVVIHVRGIPGPGPTRIVALVLALLVLAGGIVLALKAPIAPVVEPAAESFEERRASLLARAAELDREFQRGEIGPEYHAQQMADAEEELAALLYEQSRRDARGPAALA